LPDFVPGRAGFRLRVVSRDSLVEEASLPVGKGRLRSGVLHPVPNGLRELELILDGQPENLAL